MVTLKKKEERKETTFQLALNSFSSQEGFSSSHMGDTDIFSFILKAFPAAAFQNCGNYSHETTTFA